MTINTWRISSAIVFVAALVTILVAVLLPFPYGFVAIGFAAFAVIVAHYLHPKYRYWRFANSVFCAWFGTRGLPYLRLESASEFHRLIVEFSNSLPVLFDIAVAFVIVVLVWLDAETRDSIKSRIRLIGGRIFSPQSQGQNSNASKNVIVGDIYGDNAKVNIAINEEKKDFNSIIDLAKQFLEESKPDAAIVRLNELKRESWDKLGDRAKYRLLANLGHAHNQKNQNEAAADFFLDARSYQPDDIEAAGIEAIAFLLLDDTKKASKLAKEVLNEAPRNENAWIVKIHTLGDDVSLDDLENSIPKTLVNKTNVVFAICELARRRNEFSTWLLHARRLIELSPVDESAQLNLGCALSSLAFEGHIGKSELENKIALDYANECREILTGVLQRESVTKQTRVFALYHRALAEETRGELGNAESDFRAAVRERPKDPKMVYQLCIFFVRHSKYQDAIRLFEDYQSEESEISPVILLADLLFERGNSDDLDRAEKLLIGILESEAPDIPVFGCLELLARELTKCGYEIRARELATKFGEKLTNLERMTIEALLEVGVNEKEKATRIALEAFGSIDKNADPFVLYMLGRTLTDLGKDHEATEVLKNVIEGSSLAVAGKLILETAWKAKDYEFIIQFAARLRNLGRSSAKSIVYEVTSLEIINEFDYALQLIDECLESSKDEEFKRYLRLKRSWIGKLLENESLVTYDLNDLPKFEDQEGSGKGALEALCGVAHLLSIGPNPNHGYEFAYEIVRRFFDEPMAHQCIIQVTKLNSERGVEKRNRVDEKSAVAISDCKSGEITWRVIELENPATIRNEIQADSKLAQRLMDKSVGDKVKTGGDELQPKFGVIEEIIDKISYRVMDSARNWSTRFDDSSFLREFDFGDDKGELDVEEFLEVQRKLNEPTEHAISVYRHNLNSIGVFANSIGRSYIDTVGFLACNDETHIQCCIGDEQERQFIDELIKNELKIVVDPTSLATMYIHKIDRSLREVSEGLIVTIGTLETVKSLRRDKNSAFYSKRMIGYRNGRPFLEIRDDDEIQLGLERLSEFIQWIEDNFEILGGRGILSIPISVRERARNYFGTAMVESLGVAQKEDAVLCSDDQALCGLLSEVSSTRMWTTSLLQYLASRSVIEENVKNQILIDLIVSDYRFTPVSTEMIDLAGHEGQWDVDTRRLRALVDWLNKSNVLSPASMAVCLIEKTWQNSQLFNLRSKMVLACIASICKRNDSISCLRQLHAILRTVFKDDPDSLDYCQKAIRREEARELSVAPIILPGDPDFFIPARFRRKWNY